MLKNRLTKIVHLLALALFVAVPGIMGLGTKGAMAGHTIPCANFVEDQIYAFWDLRDRESFVQVTNTSPGAVFVHVQVFNSATGCAEFDFDDFYTGGDTHVYDIRNLTRNDGGNLSPPVLTGGFGFVAVSNNNVGSEVLIGNFRVIDVAGYEYRSNTPGNFEGGAPSDVNTLNFSGPALVDVVGIAANADNSATVLAGPGVTATFSPVFLFDLFEGDVSCPDVTFACGANFDVGINQAILNSKGAGSICLGTENAGFLSLPFAGFGGGADFFVGFIGLNSGPVGSMDVWWSRPNVVVAQ